MEILIRSLEISLAICGLRIVSSEGMILYFLRMPYEWLQNELKMNVEYLKFIKKNENYSKRYYNKEKRIVLNHKIAIYLLKPVIGCTTCMASAWTIVIEYSYFNISKWTILLIFMVACLNSIFYALFEKLEKP